MKNPFDTSNIPEDRKQACNKIIHTAAASAGGVGTGLAQMPLADNVVITPIQITMIVALGKVFDQKVSETAAKALLASMAASYLGRGASQVLVGWIPIVGNAVNTATAAGITELIGWKAAEHFNKLQLSSIGCKYEAEAEKEDDAAQQPEEDPKVAALQKRADEFLSGAKTKAAFNKDYNDLLNQIEDMLARLPEDHPLGKTWHDLAGLTSS